MITTASILIGITLIVVTIPYIIGPPLGKAVNLKLPFLPKRPPPSATTNPVIAAISDLDFDYWSGVINQEDYLITRQQLLSQAAQYYSRETTEIDDRIEKLIEQRKQTRKHLVSCPNCGAVVKGSDNFCVSCGLKLN